MEIENTYRGVARNLLYGDKRGGLGQIPGGVWGEAPEAGDQC